MDTPKESKTQKALRDQLLAGLTPFNEFAEAINKHPATLRKMCPPTVHIGRDPYVPTEQGRAWLLNNCRTIEPEGRVRRGRRGRGETA
jgi:hypothetical protein